MDLEMGMGSVRYLVLNLSTNAIRLGASKDRIEKSVGVAKDG
jgi:hypothetical protein